MNGSSDEDFGALSAWALIFPDLGVTRLRTNAFFTFLSRPRLITFFIIYNVENSQFFNHPD